MHKNPFKSRLINTVPRWSVKPCSKAVTAESMLIYNQIEHCKCKTQYYSGIKSFWPVQNNETVVDEINKKIQEIKLSQFPQ